MSFDSATRVMTGVRPAWGAWTIASRTVLASLVFVLTASCTSDIDVGARAESEQVMFVTPNPRVADSVIGDLDVAILFVQLTDAPAATVDPDDVQAVFGSVAGGVALPGGEDPGFISVAEYYQVVSHDTLRLHQHLFPTTVSLRGTPGTYCPLVNRAGNGVDIIREDQYCDYEGLFADALSAAETQLDFEADDYDAFAIYVGGIAVPGWAGRTWGYEGVNRRGSLYSARTWTLGFDANPGDVSYKSLLIHELGHALGNLEHAGQWVCHPDTVGDTPLDPEDSCLVYMADPWSPMGANGVRGLSAYNRNLWGFIDESHVYWTWPTSGHFHTVDLAAIEVEAPGEYQEIRIPLADGNEDFYSIEYRRPLGVDAAPLTGNETADFPGLSAGDALDGLVIRLRAASLDPDFVGETLIVHHLVTPTSPFNDPYRNITISMTELPSHRARVHLAINVLDVDP